MYIRILVAAFILLIPVGILALPFVSQVFSGPVILVDASTDSPVAVENVVLEKPVLFVFTAGWCGPCKQMKASVYPSPQVKQVADKVTWIFIDIDLPENRALVAEYEVKSVPTYFLEDTNGSKLAQASGGMSPDSFKKFLEQAL